jgi:hypothetical protein
MLGSKPSFATVLNFDYSTGEPHVIGTVTGTGGTLTFTLDLDDPTGTKEVSGNFSMALVGPDSLWRGFVSLGGDTQVDGPGPQPLGDAALFSFGDLENVSGWFLTVGSSDLPLTLTVTSQLDSFAPFHPVLTVDVTGDLTVSAAAVPLPGALALFVGGAGLLGFAGTRRRVRPSRS